MSFTDVCFSYGRLAKRTIAYALLQGNRHLHINAQIKAELIIYAVCGRAMRAPTEETLQFCIVGAGGHWLSAYKKSKVNAVALALLRLNISFELADTNC